MGMSKDLQSFRNISLSYRGAERQQPNLLQLGLRFSKVMERNAGEASGNTEVRLRKVIQDFNSSPGLHVKHQIHGEKERAIFNLIAGSCKAGVQKHVHVLLNSSVFSCFILFLGLPEEARHLMSQHLSFFKWKESAFSTEQLKTTRWLLGARPKQCSEGLEQILTVSPMSQTMLMELHIKAFTEATRKLKPSARARGRASTEDFEKLVDFSCVFAALRNAAKSASSDKGVDAKLLEAFLAK